MLGNRLGIPIVVSARGSDINLFSRFPTIRPLIRQLLTRADALIAVSQSLKEIMVQLGCRPEKVTVISNGVDSLKFQPRPQPEMRRLLGLPTERSILLSVGNLTQNKGFHILIDAVAELRRNQYDVLLLIIGEGIDRSHNDVRSHVTTVGEHRYFPVDEVGRIGKLNEPEVVTESPVVVYLAAFRAKLEDMSAPKVRSGSSISWRCVTICARIRTRLSGMRR